MCLALVQNNLLLRHEGLQQADNLKDHQDQNCLLVKDHQDQIQHQVKDLIILPSGLHLTVLRGLHQTVLRGRHLTVHRGLRQMVHRGLHQMVLLEAKIDHLHQTCPYLQTDQIKIDLPILKVHQIGKKFTLHQNLPGHQDAWSFGHMVIRLCYAYLTQFFMIRMY